MKQLILSTLVLIAINALAQPKGGYFSIRGGYAIQDELKKGIAQLSIGVSPNHTLGVGAGVGYIDFDKPYIPLTFDISFFGKPGKISPTVIGSAGYGVYRYQSAITNVKGGFTGSLSAGIAIPVKNYTKVFITTGYNIYGFSSKSFFVGDHFFDESNVKMFTITAGIKI